MGLRDLLDGGRPDSVEDFLLRLVAVVRDDEEDEGDRRDLYRGARKRRRRLAVLALAAGPLVGAANQLADPYCETAVVCDVADLHGLSLSDEEIGAEVPLAPLSPNSPSTCRPLGDKRQGGAPIPCCR